jgi:hypothetical protein
MMTLKKEKHPSVKDDLLHVRFDNICIHTVIAPPNIQAWGLHIPQKGATTPLQ